MRIYTTDVIPTSIVSDHDAPFACTNVRVNRYQPRYKYIRNMKTFDEQEFISDLDTLPLNIVYSSDDLEEQLEYFNSMFKECLERHAPLRRVRVTRPPAPWMDDSQIRSLQQLRNKFRKEAHQTGSQESWELFRDVRNKLKAAIRRARETFTRQALSSNKPKEVWRIIHRILKPNQQPLRQDPDKLNSFFACTAERTLPVSSDLPFCLEELIESLPDDSPANFKLREVSHGEVLRVLKLLRSDTSTGPDSIPVKFVKMVADSIAGPLTAIINNCIRKYYFPKALKNARISPIPKVDQPKSEEHFRLISILPTLSKVFEKLVALQMTTFCEYESVLRDTISSFRKGHSTNTVLMGMCDDLLRAMKKGEVKLLYIHIRNCSNFKVYCREVNAYLLNTICK